VITPLRRSGMARVLKGSHSFTCTPQICIKYSIPDAVPAIHAVSSHVATDKDPSKFRSIFSDDLQPIATRGKKARDPLLVDIGCSSKRAPLSVSYYNEISGGHIGSCRCSEEGLCRPSTAPVLHTPRSSANEMNHTCLCIRSRSWYSFTDPGWMEG